MLKGDPRSTALFNIYVEDITNIIREDTKPYISLYANDIVITSPE